MTWNTNHGLEFRDGLDDYLDLDPKTGELKAYLNLGFDVEKRNWPFRPIGTIASGLGPGHRVRIADIDGDGVSTRLGLPSLVSLPYSVIV